jgi:lactoylglutathione lyase
MSTQSMASADSTRVQSEPFAATVLMASLTVRDIHRSLSWYRDIVGFTVETQMEREGKLRAVRLSAGPVRILINQDDGAKGWDRAKGEGFSLTFNTNQDIDDIANGIKARGGELASEPADMPWGVRMFRLVDPDGYKLSISKPN